MNKKHEIIILQEYGVRIDLFISDIRKKSKPPGRRVPVKRYVDIMIDRVGRDICRSVEIKFDDLVGPSQKQDFNRARQIFFYVCRKLIPGKTFKQLAAALGRHYSTAMHGEEKVKDYLEMKRSDFMPTWEKFLENTKLYTHDI